MAGRLGASTDTMPQGGGRLSNPTSSSGGGRLTSSAPTPAPNYFYTKTSSGATLGRSDQLDTSGLPFVGYRNPGDNATSTDRTRIATTFNPLESTTTPATSFLTPRNVPNSPQLKTSLGGTSQDELDHRMALELSGSNDRTNLGIQHGRLGGQAKTSDNLENSLKSQVASGKISLQQAQEQLAKSKGLNTPFNPNPPPLKVNDSFDSTPLGIGVNTVLGLPKGLWDVSKNITDFLTNVPKSLLREAGSVALTGQNAVKVAKGQGNEVVTQYQAPNTGVSITRGLFGNEPINDLATQTINLGENLKGTPLDKEVNVAGVKFNPYAFAGVIGSTALDMSPLGGEENVVSSIAKSTDKAFIAKILQRIGVNPELALQYAEKLAQVSDKKEVTGALKNLETLQKTTNKLPTSAVNRTVDDTIAGNIDQLKGTLNEAPSKGGRLDLESMQALSDIEKNLPKGLTPEERTQYYEIAKRSGREDLVNQVNKDVVKPQTIAERQKGRIPTNRGFAKNPLADFGQPEKKIPAIEKVTDPAERQKIENGITEGQNILMTGKSSGRKLSSDQLLAVKRAVDNGLEKLTPVGLKNVSEADRLIAEGKIKVTSVNGKDTYHYQNPKGEWKRAIGEDNAVNMVKNPPVPKSTLPQALEERKIALDLNKQAMKENPMSNLSKYSATRGEMKGRLPEVLGKGTSQFGKKGDTILTEHLGNIDSEAARSKYEKFASDKKALQETEQQLKQDIKTHKTNTAQEAIRTDQTRSSRSQTGDIGKQGKGVLPVSSSQKYTQIPTKNKVEFKITGTGKDRIQSAIVNSERALNEIKIRGKDAETIGQGLNSHDLKLAEGLEHGTPVQDLVKQAQNPIKLNNFLKKLTDYYDFRLATDRAAGGTTGRVEHYLPHQWDVSNPKDLARFNDLAKQRGLQEYKGFHAQPRVFKTYAEGEQMGFKRANKNILGDLKKDYESSSHVISKQVLKKGLYEAAPRDVSLQGMGRTNKGVPFVNSNIHGLEGISYHPEISKMLKGYEPLKNTDVFSLMKDKGFDIAKPSTYNKAWDGIREGGVLNTVGTLYDHSSKAMKNFILNFSGFHPINVSANYGGASIFNPIKGIRGLSTSIPSFFSEKVTQKIVDGFKNKLVKGQDFSIFDAGLRSGVNMDRGVPATGLKRLNPFTALSRAMFDRELHTLKLNLVDQVFSSGKVLPESAEGRALGKQINMIMGEMNNRTMNINPNTQKWLSRILLAPQFTESKYKLIGDALTKGEAAGGNLARKAVVGKSLVMGTLATFGTLLATGKYPDLKQILLNYTTNPSSQTNITNQKGQKQDIGYPQTFVTEPLSAIADPIHYGEARLAPGLSDAISISTNKDYFNNPIYDKNKPESALSQYGKNIGIGDLPIGAQSLIRQAQGKQTGAQTALQIAGLKTHISPTDSSKEAASLLQEQTDTRAKLLNEAKKQVETIDSLPKDQQEAAFQEIVKSNPDLAKEIKTVKSQKDLGFNSTDYEIKKLGVLNGVRAKFIAEQMNKMSTREQRTKYWDELVGKKLITPKVAQEINDLMK